MSVTTTKASLSPSELEISTERRIEAEIDAKFKDPDTNRNLKASLQGIRERIASAWHIASSDLPFDKFSQDEPGRRAALSSYEMEQKMRTLITQAQQSAAEEVGRRASGARLEAKVSSIQRPSRKTEQIAPGLPGIAPSKPPLSRAPYQGPHPHVKVLPSIQLNLDVPTIDSLTDRQAGGRLECSMALTRVVAAPIHATGHVVSATIKKLREDSPLVDAMAKGAGTAVRAAKDWVKEEIPGSTGFVRDFRSNLSRLPGDIEEEYGIPQEKTRQWIEDTSAIATTAAFAGAGKVLQVAGKSMLATPPMQIPVNSAPWTISGIVTPSKRLLSPAIASSSERAMVALSDGVVVLTRPFRKGTRQVTTESLTVAPPKALPPPRRLLPAPPKVATEATVQAAAPVATTRDWVVSNIAASKASHASAAYQAFDRAVSAAALARASPPVVPTNSGTPRIRQRPLRNHTPYEPIEPSRIPTRDTAQPTTFHRRVETVPADGHLYDVELACMRHECGTWSLFAQKFTPHNPQALTTASSGRVLAKVRSALIYVARDHLDAPAVVLQWNPEVLVGLADVAEGAAKRTVHYAGEKPAIETLTPIGSLQRLGKAAIGASLDIPGRALPLDHHLPGNDKAFKSDALGYAGHFFVDESTGTRPISITDSLLTTVISLTRKERAVPTLTFDFRKVRSAKAPASPVTDLEPVPREGAVTITPTNAAPRGAIPTNSLFGRASLIESARPVSSGMQSAGETVVIFKSTLDHNGALAESFTEQAKVLAKGRNLHMQEVTVEGEMISTLRKIDRVSHVLIRGHGCELGFALNPLYGIDASEIADVLGHAHFTTEGRPEVMLEACSMGKRPPSGFLSPAEELYGLLNGRVSVIAANDIMSSMLTQTTPGSIRFFAQNGDSLQTIERTVRVGRIPNHDNYNQLAEGNSIYFRNGQAVRFAVTPEVFTGVLPQDLIVVQAFNETGSDPFFLSAEKAQGLTRHGPLVVDSYGRHVTSASLLPSIKHMKVIRIPAGEIVNVLTGAPELLPQLFGSTHMHSSLGIDLRPGAQQHYFYDIDPRWPSVMVQWPLAPNTNLSDFESLSSGFNTEFSRDKIIQPALEGHDQFQQATAAGTIGPSRGVPTNSAPMVEKTRPISSGMKPAGETVVVIESAYDNTGAFTLPITTWVEQLARGRNLVYRRHVESIEEIRAAMQLNGNVSHVLVRAHGNPRAVHFGSNGTKPEALAYALNKECLVEGRRAEVFLEACSTAAKPSDGSESFAVRLSARLGDRASVVAARAPVIPNYTQMKPGSVQFYGEHDPYLMNCAIPNNLRRSELTFRIGRMNNSETYTKLIRRERIPSASKYLHFTETPKVFSGVTPRDLVFVQYHNGLPSNTWFISADDAMVLTTMDAIRRQTVLSESIAPFTHMTVTRIPAGENINTLRGNVIAEGKWDTTVHRSGIMQYYFYDFDPKWESVTFAWPCSAEGLDNFDALVTKAVESKVTSPTLSLRSKTVYEENKEPSIRQPLPNPMEAQEASLLAKPSIPPLSDVVPKTFQEILTSIEYDGVSADLMISRIGHADGTSRVYIEHLIVQDCDLGDQTLTSGLIFQTLTTIRKIVEKEWGGSHVFIQWDPMNPKFLTPSFQAHLERYRHYIGLHDAFPVSPKLMEMRQADEELKARKYPTLVYELKALL